MSLTSTLPIRADVDIAALFDTDRILDAPIRRRLLLTYICQRRRPESSAEELNRVFCITRNAAEVSRCLFYLRIMDEKLRTTFRGVDFKCPLDIIAHVPYWIKYGSVVEMYHDINAL